MGDTYDDYKDQIDFQGTRIGREAPDDGQVTIGEQTLPYEENSPESEYDPLDGGGGTRIATLITLMRLYDVQLALLSESDDALAQKIMEIHAQGRVIAEFPSLSL